MVAEAVSDGMTLVVVVVKVTEALAAAWRVSSGVARVGGFSSKTNNPTPTIRAVE
jgi:hypothetical protein